jgi:hypothetical protein
VDPADRGAAGRGKTAPTWGSFPRRSGQQRRGPRCDARTGISNGEADRALKIARITPEAKAAAKAAGLENNQSALLKVARLLFLCEFIRVSLLENVAATAA